MRVLAVCLGNICRSPTAEAALREAAGHRGLDLMLDSAGTAAYHVGNPPDQRMRAAAAASDLALVGAARQVEVADFERFDLILAMDRTNYADLRSLAPTSEAAGKIRLFRDFEEDASSPDVPDPYYGGPDGFLDVVAIARRSAAGVVAALATGSL